MTRRDGKTPSQRQLRVGEELRHSLAWVLERGDLRDPALQGNPLTVTEIRVSPDLKNATCFFTPLGGGGEEQIAEILSALDRAKGFLRHELASKVNLRYAPKLSFEFDQSFDEAGKIDALLHSPQVAADIAKVDETENDD
ncbi:MAG: 30S ribosome-binding factor RbfA [Rhodospirillaceae bacterium]|nr:30S ribosome-binding factor RbfA [Rhodospirillaceae bacterium]